MSYTFSGNGLRLTETVSLAYFDVFRQFSTSFCSYSRCREVLLVIYSPSNWKKNDGTGRIRTGDHRHARRY
jgi:hypothetical protein